MDREEYMMALASSFMISADNAHAVHPNHQEKADPTNRPYMNGGIVIKYNGNQKYATDAVSAAVFKSICKGCCPISDICKQVRYSRWFDTW